jgi:hypothetical protein
MGHIHHTMACYGSAGSMYVIGITNLRISKEVVTGNGVTGACDGVLRPGSGAFVWSPSALQNPARGRALEQVIGLHHATDPGLKH